MTFGLGPSAGRVGLGSSTARVVLGSSAGSVFLWPQPSFWKRLNFISKGVQNQSGIMDERLDFDWIWRCVKEQEEFFGDIWTI